MLVMPGIAEFRPEVLGTGKRDDHEAPLKEPVGFVSGQGVTERAGSNRNHGHLLGVH